WCNYDQFKLNGLVGFRWLTLTEQLRIDSTAVLPPVEDPTIREIVDNFTTRNNFYGGQLGLESEFRAGRCFVDVTTKIAAGVTDEFLSIEGRTRFVDTGVTNIVPSGLLALETNSGRTHRNEFAFVPEFNLKFGFQVTQHMSIFTGYNVLYISKVQR